MRHFAVIVSAIAFAACTTPVSAPETVEVLVTVPVTVLVPITITPIETSEISDIATDVPAETEEATVGNLIAYTDLAAAEFNGIQLEIASLVFGPRDFMIESEIAVIADQRLDDDRLEYWDRYEVIGKIVWRISNTTDRALDAYPTQGALSINGEQISFDHYPEIASTFDLPSGGILPHSTFESGLYFGINQTLEDLSQLDAAYCSMPIYDAETNDGGDIIVSYP